MTQNDNIQQANEETRRVWDANASFWDQKMGEGNDFVNELCWPSILRLLDPQPGQRILDIATGNGLTARRLAALGAKVWASDFSSELIRIAQSKPNPSDMIRYQVVDATDESALLGISGTLNFFDSALCNMALFDMAEIEPLFRTLPRLLKPGGAFVFTLTHPAFNNASCVHVVEERDDEGQIEIVYSVKISKYITPFQARGLAIRGQPQAQIYFDRPLQTYFNLGFQNGFVLDGFEERAFPPDHSQGSPLGWGGKFSEIPPVLAARMRISR